AAPAASLLPARTRTARAFPFIRQSIASFRIETHAGSHPNSSATKFRYSPVNQKEIIRQLL
ncbi:hypothetical protein QM312_35790, partial [Burkholderia cenocepacia]|uniref:hypothetical protein n=1 Tax=Burkholderia cenocepacia TaxID=95486 RepID=UPI0024B7D97C